MGQTSIKAVVFTPHSKHAGLHKSLTIGMVAAGLLLTFYPLNSLNFLHDTPPNWNTSWPGMMGYLLAASLIWWERRNLAFYHLDGLALGLFIAARPLETFYLALIHDTDTGMAFPSLYSLVGCGAAFLLAAALWQDKCLPGKLRWSALAWAAAGLFTGVFVSLGLGWLYSYTFVPKDIFIHLSGERVAKQSLAVFIILLGHQVIIEEVILRGFVWGLLKQTGWKDVLIWMFQAILAMVCGITLINREPMTFWLIIPLATLVPALLVWRSRSVAASMLARAVIAGLIFWSAYLFATARF